MQHTISVLVNNRFGVLSRISGLFSGRGFNIESLNVAETNDPDVSRMTIVTLGDNKKIEQITKQLNKLVDVIKVVDLTEENFVDRELILIKMNAEGSCASSKSSVPRWSTSVRRPTPLKSPAAKEKLRASWIYSGRSA